MTQTDLLFGVRGILDGGDLIHVGPDDERTGLTTPDHDYTHLALSTGSAGTVEHLREAAHDRFRQHVQPTLRVVERDPSYTIGVDLERR